MIQFQKLLPDVKVPHRIHKHDAAFDVYSNEDRAIRPHDWQLCKTGLVMSLPPGYVAMVLPRSGMAVDSGITVLNAPGLVDPNYRGELGVTLINHGPEVYRVKRFDRIAQLLVVSYAQANVTEVEVIDPAPDERGTGGFGSTGR